MVDHNRDVVVNRCLKEFADEEVRSAVWGIAYHWYCSERSENLSLLHALYPEKHIFLSECSVELGGEEIGDWTHAERYGRQIIRDFNHGSEGWIDWNLALDEQGGPNHVGNYCEAPVMYHRKRAEVLYQPSYYYIGHFSRFIEKGAKRIFCETDTDKKLYAVAYKNPNGTLVCAIQNEEGEQEINLVVNGNPRAPYASRAFHSDAFERKSQRAQGKIEKPFARFKKRRFIGKIRNGFAGLNFRGKVTDAADGKFPTTPENLT